MQTRSASQASPDPERRTAPSVHVLETPSLGDRSYLVHDGEVAFVVDPQRDIDRMLALAEEHGVRITHVFETHIHNDYVTGGLALAQATGAAYHVNADDEVSFEREPVRDGEVVEVSPTLRLRPIHTPGHTFTHLSYALEGEHPVVFTGGSLLFGSTGRPDLLGEEHAASLAGHQHASAHRLADELPDATRVMPTHGFGSFCSSTQADGDVSTIGQERSHNPVLRQSRDDYVREILDGLDVYPAYYAHMGPANAAGPGPVSLDLPSAADKDVLRERLLAGEWVVDLRNRQAYSAAHVPGTVNIGLDGQFSTWLGWVLPWGSSITLLGDTVDQVAQAQRELVRIGIDELAGQATGEPQEWTDGELASLPRGTFADLAQVRHHRPVTVLDVRNPGEHAERHVEGSLNIPLGDLVGRLAEVPGGEVWVHCAGGYRASVAASVLAAAGGRRVVAVDDGFDHASEAGLPLTDA